MLELALDWSSSMARHRERRLLSAEAAELAPIRHGAEAGGAPPGEWLRIDSGPAARPPIDESLVLDAERRRFEATDASGASIQPRVGRFYPRIFLRDPGAAQEDARRPMRCLGEDGASVRLDLNHPMAAHAFRLSCRKASPAATARRSETAKPQPLTLLLGGGPGMQARLPGSPTDFYADHPFERRDSRPDRVFYGKPRFVHHVDDLARAHIVEIHSRFLSADMAILDLMASWDSHLPPTCDGARITGLGMNNEELKANPRLAARVIRDLNQDPVLPFDEAAFDAVLCAVSAEYLARPIEVFREVRRVLKPGGVFVVTLSERWFPPKVIRLWVELHPFERMGLVLDYFERAGGYTGLETESIRGWPRPAGDRYADRLAFSDPVYAVWGRRETDPA